MSDHRAHVLHPLNPDRPALVWESARGPVLVAEMTADHLRAAVEMCARRGFDSLALPAMRARLASLEAAP